jgi:hypothetical protein
MTFRTNHGAWLLALTLMACATANPENPDRAKAQQFLEGRWLRFGSDTVTFTRDQMLSHTDSLSYKMFVDSAGTVVLCFSKPDIVGVSMCSRAVISHTEMEFYDANAGHQQFTFVRLDTTARTTKKD